MNPEDQQEERKSSLEQSMENYLKEELGTGDNHHQPDIVQSSSTANTADTVGDNNSDAAVDAMVTSAIISVDDVDAEDNIVNDDKDSKDDNDVNSNNETPAATEATKDNEVPTITTEEAETVVADNHCTNMTNNQSMTPPARQSLTPPSKITLPKIQISPESGVASSEDSSRPSPLSSLSPSRIPSRKNSSQTSQSQAINDDLRKLESRLERFVGKSSEGSECSENSDQSGNDVQFKNI